MNKNKIEENSGHFKMRLDENIEEIEAAGMPADVDEMRLEKINTRVTIISILIPVLIAIVLVIAYLDIKKRVVRTEDEGSMSFQNLSADLESRFSSLSLRQAELEKQLSALSASNDKALARIEVELKKLGEITKAFPGDPATKKNLNAAVAGVEKKIDNIAGGFEQSKEQWLGEIEQLRTASTEVEQKLTGLADKMVSVEQEKMDKPAMELALGLEALKIKQTLKVSIDELSRKFNLLEKEVKSMKNQVSQPRSSPAPAYTPSPIPQPEPRVEDKPDTEIMEENIN